MVTVDESTNRYLIETSYCLFSQEGGSFHSLLLRKTKQPKCLVYLQR